MFTLASRVLAASLVSFALLGQIRLGIRVVSGGGSSNVLTVDDITYNGVIRTQDTDTFSAVGSLTGRQVGGDTHLFLYASSGGVDYPDVLEMDVTGLTPNTNIGSSPTATLVTNWGDDWGPTRQSWNGLGDEQNMVGFGNAYNRGIYWHEANQLLYMAYSINYTDIAWWSVLAMSLDDDSPVTITACGPWRFSYDTASRGEDGTRTHTLSMHPTTGKMIGTGGSKSGHTAIPWGPSMIGGADWPTCSTTGGEFMTPIEMTHTYLNYYFPEPPQQASSTYSVSGAPIQTIKQFQFPSYLTYAWETYATQPLRADPALNGGRGTWSSESSGCGQPVWFNGTNKQGVIFPCLLQGALGTDPEDCVNTAHEWYRNSANGYVKVSGVSGSPSGVMTGGTSGDSGTIIGTNGAYIFFNDGEGDEFLVGETVSGSGWSATVDEFDNFDTCNHGCENPLATGPVSTKDTSVFIIYDPATLAEVDTGAIEDYEAEAASVISVRDEYSLVTGADNGKGNGIDCGYLVGTTLYCISHQADLSITGNPNAMTALIHVFTIDDSAPPAPSPLLPLSAGVALWAMGGLIRRRAA